MRRRLLAAGGALVLALVPFVALPGTASAVAASAVGYWSKTSAPGPLQPVLTPPNVPEGGVFVAQDPSGPASVATIRYPVTEAGGGQLVLKVAQASTIQTATLNICPVAEPWEPTENGPFDDQPANGCADLMINGSVSDDSSSVSFFIPVTFPLNDGNLEIFIVAAESSAPFTVAFEAPGEESFVPAEGGGSEEFPGFEGGGDFGSGDGAGSDSGFAPGGDSGSGSTSDGSFGGSTAGSGSSGSGFSAPTPSSGGSFTPSAGSSGSTGGAFTAPGTSGVTSPAVTSTDGTATGGTSTGGTETAAPPALAGAQGDPDDGTARTFAIITLVAIGAGMFLLSARGGGVAALAPGQLVTAPVAAASGGAITAADRRRGVGRFARPRLGPPVRL